MKRTTAIVVMAAGALVALAVAAIVWRAPIAEAGIRAWLRSAGLADPRLTVTRVDLDGLEIHDLRASARQPLEIGRLRVGYTAADLLDGRVGDVEVRGARLPFVRTDGGLRVAGIPIDGGASAPGEEISLPFDTLRVQDTSFHADTPVGPATLTVNGTARRGAEEGFSASFDVVLRGDGIDLAGTVAASGAATSDFTGEMTVARGHATFESWGLRALTGRGDITVRAGGIARAGLALEAGEASLPGPGGPLHGAVTAQLDYTPPLVATDVVFREASGAGAYALRLDEASIAATGDSVAGETTLHVSADRLALADIEARDLRLEVPIRARYEDARATISTRGTGTIEVAGIRLAESLRTTGPLRLVLASPDAPLLSLDLAAEAPAAYSLSLRTEALPLEILRDSARPVPVAAHDLRLALSGTAGGAKGNVVHGMLSAASAVLPDQQTGVDALAATFHLEGSPPRLTAELDLQSIHHLGDPPLFAPLAADATIAGPLDALAIDAALQGAGGVPRARIRGTWPPKPDGGIVATLGPFAFTPDGLQPGDLSPRLRAFEAVRGRVAGSMHIGETADAPSMTGELALEDLSFEIAGTGVDSLTTRVEIVDLGVPATAPGQVLTVSRMDLPTPLDDLRAVYRLEAGAGGEPLLHIASARTDVLGGSVSLPEIALDLAGGMQSLPFRVEGVELSRLFALAGLDGIEGTGELHGEVPVLVSASSIAIRDSRLESTGGVLHIRSDAASDLLAGQGEQVDLALRALEDFRYSELSIAVDKPLEGPARLAVSTLGHNPAVLDGHPFRFNVTLTSDVDELIAAILRGYRMAIDALGDASGTP